MNLLNRFKAKTPEAWKTVIKASCTLKVACGGILGLNLATPLPSQLTTYAGWVLAACIVITTFAATQVEKPEDK